MSWFDIAAAGIGAVGSLIGGRKASKSADANTRAQIAAQERFAQQGIQWRVRDAKAAGLHPLFALGAQVPAFSPVPFDSSSRGQSISDASQHIGRAVAATQTVLERRAAAAQVKLLESQADEQELRTDFLRSQLILETQPGMQTFPVVDPAHDLSPDTQMIPGPNAPPVNQSNIDFMDPGAPFRARAYPSKRAFDLAQNANEFPMWTEFRIGKNHHAQLMGGATGDPSEALESIAESPILMWMTFVRNAQVYGEADAERFMSTYFGKPWEEVKAKMKAEMKSLLPWN